MRRPLTAAAAFGLVAWQVPCAAAITYWLGCPNGKFSDSACWTTTPQSLASPRVLEFNGGQSPTDDIASLEIATLQFNGNSVGTQILGPAVLGLHASGTNPVIVQLQGTNELFTALSIPLTSDVADTVEMQVQSGELHVYSPLQGTAGPRKTGAGTLAILGNNSYAGPLRIDDGVVTLNASGFDTAVPYSSPTVYVGDGTGAGSTAVLRELSGHNISNSTALVMAADGWFDLNGYTDAVASLSGYGKVSLGSGTLQLKTSGAANFQGAITGASGAVQMSGSGIQVLSGPNSYSGPTDVLSGELRIQGTQVSSPVGVHLGGKLRGTGTIGPLAVDAGGTVEAGDGSFAGGVLTVGGGANFASGATLRVQICGAGAYEKLSVAGAAGIDGVNLDVSFVSYVPPPGTEFTVLTANGGVTGSFAGHPDGTPLCVNGTRMFIYYSSTAVTLSVVSDSPQVTPPASIVVSQTTCP